MKRKIISTLVTAGIAFTAFINGQNSVNLPQAADSTMIAVEDVTDWNTNGAELSLAMRDGSEVTAYKTADVYKPERKQYIALDEIASVNCTESGYTIVTLDGNIFQIGGAEK